MEVKSFDVNLDEQTVTAEIEVTRSDDDGYDGEAMDVVELYVQSPYTEYDVENKIEKAAIQLLDYEKTDALAPGESTTVTINVDMKYMASYDYTNAKTYILDDGEYYFALGNGAHDALNNILAAQNVSGVSGGYAYANSSLMNGTSEDSYVVNVMTWWRILFIVLIAVSAVLLVGSLAGYTFESLKQKKED